MSPYDVSTAYSTDCTTTTLYYDCSTSVLYGDTYTAPQPSRAESATEWLDRRVNEMRVKL